MPRNDGVFTTLESRGTCPPISTDFRLINPTESLMAKPAVRIAVTGAAGQIGYSILFRIAGGEILGKDQPVILQLLEIPDEKVQAALKGVIMELDDCAFPLLAGMSAASDAKVAFKDAEIAILVGARPRTKGMERKDLL